MSRVLNLNHKVQGGNSKCTAGFPLQYPKARRACTIAPYLISLVFIYQLRGQEPITSIIDSDYYSLCKRIKRKIHRIIIRVFCRECNQFFSVKSKARLIKKPKQFGLRINDTHSSIEFADNFVRR